MKMDILLAGVGGQGTVLASKIIAQTAMNQENFVRTSETIGMAQRGGCVVSHVRIGAKECSPSIPQKAADVIIGFEPAEAVRNMGLLKPAGKLLVNSNPITPVTASLGGGSYQVDEIIEYLEKLKQEVIVVDGQKLCQVVGSGKVLNVVMLGVVIKKGLLNFSKDDILQTIMKNLPPKIIPLNIRALEVGYDFETYLGEERGNC